MKWPTWKRRSAARIEVLRKEDFMGMSATPELRLPYRVFFDCLVPANAESVFDANGEPVECSWHRRGRNQNGSDRTLVYKRLHEDAGPAMHHIESAVFIPYLYTENFGHLLTESASWLGVLCDPQADMLTRPNEQVPILLGVEASGSRERLSEHFGIPAERILCTDTLPGLTRIGTLIIPERTMVNRDFCSEHHFTAVKRVVDRWYGIDPDEFPQAMTVGAPGAERSKVYLSRSRLPPAQRHIEGETEIERHLTDKGWRIVHPEQLHIREQIETLRDAAVLGGNSGSSFHLLMYLGRCFGRKCVITLGSREEFGDNHPCNNLFAQIRIQPVDLNHLVAYEEPRYAVKEGIDNLRYADLSALHPPKRIAETMESIASAFLERYTH